MKAVIVIASALLCAAVIPFAEAKPVRTLLDGLTSAFQGNAPAVRRKKVVKRKATRRVAKRPAKKRVARKARKESAPVVAAKVVPEITVRPLSNELGRDAPVGSVQRGMASFYGYGFHGKPTACGAIPGHTSLYNEWRMTAAHRTLKCGTKVEVIAANGKSVILTITDRGPYIDGRIIDVSRGAAEALGMTQSGVARVSVHVLGPPVDQRGERVSQE